MTSLNPNASTFIPRTKSRTDGLRVGQLNCQSAINKLDIIEDLLITSKLDILFLTETWFAPHHSSDQTSVNGYFHYRQDRSNSVQRRGGGTAVYIRNHLSTSTTRKSDLAFSPEIEYLGIQVKIDNSHLLLFTFYRPPWQSMDMFCTDLNKNLSHLVHSKSHPIIITGDFNAKLNAWCQTDKDSADGTKLQNVLDDLGLEQLVTDTPTRFSSTGQSSSLLDLVITDTAHLLSEFVVLPPVADHCPILFSISCSRQPKPSYNRTFRDYSSIDYQHMRHYVSSLPLLECMEGATTPDSAWSVWHSYLFSAIQMFAPLKCTTIRTKKPKQKPWFNSHLHKQRKTRDRLFKAAKMNDDPTSWILYRFARNSFTSSLRAAKKRYHNELGAQLQHAHRSSFWWNKVKQLCNLSREQLDIPDIIDRNGRTATGEADKSDVFCEYFASQCQQQQQSHKPDQTTHTLDDADKFELAEVTPDDVKNSIRNLSAGKSSGGDIPNRVLLQLRHVISESLANLFNLSIRTAIFPNSWKIATVIPILKINKPQNSYDSYRPISLLPAVGKLMDHLVHKQLFNFINDNEIIHPCQYGFMRNKSTVDQLLSLTASASLSMDANLPYDMIFLDFTKAFDRVSHAELLFQLNKFVLPSSVNWISSYLSNRQMQVRVGHHLSQLQPLSAGVPQGSHLGPILFNLYINSLHTTIKFSLTHIFADDTTISRKRLGSLIPLQADISACANWALSIGGAFNASKSYHLTISRACNPPSSSYIPLYLGPADIPEVQCHKHLGVTFVSTLQWSHHTNDVIKKFRQRVFLLCQMISHLPDKIILAVYRSFVLPVAEYACPVWGVTLSAHHALTLERLQAKIARRLLYLRSDVSIDWKTPKEILFSLVPLQSLQWRRHIQFLCTLHATIIYNPQCLNNFHITLSPSARRPRYLLYNHKFGSYSSKHFLFLCLPAWNSLSCDLRTIDSKKAFRIAVMNHFAASQFSLAGIPIFAS